MKRKILFALGAAFFAAAPAAASQGVDCRTMEAGGKVGRTFALMAGTLPAPRWTANERIGDDWTPIEVGMHWIDDQRLMLQFIADDGTSDGGTIEAIFDGRSAWNGTFTLGKQVVPIRCEVG